VLVVAGESAGSYDAFVTPKYDIAAEMKDRIAYKAVDIDAIFSLDDVVMEVCCRSCFVDSNTGGEVQHSIVADVGKHPEIHLDPYSTV